MKKQHFLMGAIAVAPIACLAGYYVITVPLKNFYAQRADEQLETPMVSEGSPSPVASTHSGASNAPPGESKLPEDAEKVSFDAMLSEANDRVNMLSAKINEINRDATVETTKMCQESATNPLDTGFIKGRSFLIAQRKNKRTTEVYQEQVKILRALLNHPYASRYPQIVALRNEIDSSQNRESLSLLELAKLNAAQQNAINQDARSAREYYRSATAQLEKTRIDAEAARQKMATDDLSPRYKSSLR
jgi:hypothetical protein